MSMHRELQFGEHNDVAKVKSIQFGVMSPADILKTSVVEITNTDTYAVNEPMPNGLFDTRMGVMDHGMVCQTCKNTNAFCPGHAGHVVLAKPVFYPQFIDTVKRILQCVCFRCSAVLVDVDAPEIKVLKAKRCSRLKRWDATFKLCSKIRKCKLCAAKQPDRVSCTEDMKIRMEWRDSDNATTTDIMLGAEDVLRIFSRITEEHADILGFSSKHNRPEWFICTVMSMPPPAMRPSVRNETGQRQEDDITHILRDIIKFNIKLRERIESGGSFDAIEQSTTLLQYHFATLVNNSIPTMCAMSRDRMGRQLRTIVDRIKGKEGRFRGNLIGKRVDNSGRTVITPDPNLSIDELGVPLQMAMNLTFPEIVTEANLEEMRAVVRNGPDTYPGAKYVRKALECMRTVRLRGNTTGVDQDLVPGDIVDRHLMNGLYVLFNRQPSLHKMSMMAHRVRVMPYKTFRLNVCVCDSYNADFDGDEMNVHIPQSLQTHEEIKHLAAVSRHIVSPRNSVPIITIVQDILLGVFRMTQPHITVSPVHFMNLTASNPLFDGVMPEVSDGSDGGEDGRLTGRQLLSTVFPPNTNIKFGKHVNIRDGKILGGALNGDAFKAVSVGIVHSIFNDKGSQAITSFLNSTQKLACDWLVLQGFSVGISDLSTSQSLRAGLEDNLQEMRVNATRLINDVHNNRFKNESTLSNSDYFEALMTDVLSATKTKNQNMVMESTSVANNRLLNMLKQSGAGSKGTALNFLQMVACLGQQSIDGKRIVNGFDDRTLPHFTKHDDSPVSRGFVSRSFIEGLSPNEFFFHAMGGRIGLIDTAVRTSDTGYLQRKLVKSMEDCKVHHDYTVRNASGHIVQFLYGEDGADAAKLEYHSLLYLKLEDGATRDKYLIAHPQELVPYLREDVLDDIRASSDAFIEAMHAHYEQLQADKRFVIVNVHDKVQPSSDANVVFPVSLHRIVENALQMAEKYGMSTQRSDLDPRYVLKEIERLEQQLVVGLRIGTATKDDITAGHRIPLMGVLLRCFLSPAVLIREKRVNRLTFDKIVADITAAFYTSLVNPGEVVGVVAAQSIGEPTSQSTLNSVHYDEELLLCVDGVLERVKIGDFTEATVAAASATNLERHPGDLTLAWIRGDDDKRAVSVLSCDEEGKVAWYKVEAVTRHPVVNEDGSDTLLKVTTRTGRSVIATKAKSFLKRVNNRIVGVNGSDLKVGDRLPVSTVLPTRDVAPVEFLELERFLPPTEWLYMSHVDAILDIYNKRTKRAWTKSIPEHVKVPYGRMDAFLDAFIGCGDKNPRRPGCRSEHVYPFDTSKKGGEGAHIPEKIPLDEDFGWLVGAYLSEGCIATGANRKGAKPRPYALLVSNMSEAFEQRFARFCGRYGIGYHVDSSTRLMPSGNTCPTVSLRMHSLLMGELFMRLFGTGAAIKRIHPMFFGAPDDFLRGLLDGYWSGDGSVSNTSLSMSAYSASHGMLVDLQQIMTRFGIITRIGHISDETYLQNVERFKTANRGWILYVPSNGCAAFRRHVQLCIEYKNDRLEDMEIHRTHAMYDMIPDIQLSTGTLSLTNRSKIPEMLDVAMDDADREVLQLLLDEQVMYDEIKSIEEVSNGDRGWVYDLTVETTRNFALSSGLMSRDTFHLAGISSASGSLTLGVPRLKELFNVSKNIKTPQMQIYVRPEYAGDKDKCEEIMNNLQTASFRDVVRGSAVYYDPRDDPATTLVEEDRELLRLYAGYTDFMGTCDKRQSPWVLRFEFDRAKMLELQVFMTDVQYALAYHFDADSTLSCLFSDDGSQQLVARVRLIVSETFDRNDILTEMMALEQSILDNVVIRGVKNIDKAVLEKPKDESRVYDEDRGSYVKNQEWSIITAGSNMIDVMSNPYVDAMRTVTNDVCEVLAVLGIEAARAALYRELDNIIHITSKNEVNYRHLALLVDTMTNRGHLVAIDRHGINKSDIGPLAKCSFEETDDMLIKAGVFCEVDRVNGVAANIMLGQIPPCGTGDGEILVDIDSIVKNTPAIPPRIRSSSSSEPGQSKRDEKSGMMRSRDVALEGLLQRAPRHAKKDTTIYEEDEIEII